MIPREAAFGDQVEYTSEASAHFIKRIFSKDRFSPTTINIVVRSMAARNLTVQDSFIDESILQRIANEEGP